MKYLLMTFFAGLLIPAVAGGQELPKVTAEGKEALAKLADACAADGGLKIVETPKGKQFTVADEDKVRATVAAHPELLTPALRDALVVVCARGDEAVRPTYVALLRAYGHEKKDELALGMAAYLPARAAERRGQHSAALRLYQEAREHFGTAKEPAWQAITLNNMGSVYDTRGEYARAQDYYERGLALYQGVYEGPHSHLAASLNNIGVVYAEQGECTKALEYHQRALAMLEKLHEGPHHDIAGTLIGIGSVYEDQRAYARALDYYQRALALRQNLYQAPHARIATSLGIIGMAYRARGEYPRALDYLQRALTMFQALHDGPDDDIAIGLTNIGLTYDDLGEYGRALDYLQRSLAMSQKLHEGSHPDTILTLQNIAEVCRAHGEYPKALEFHQRALAMRQKWYGRSHPDIASSFDSIGLVYDAQGEYAQALHALNEALDVLRLAPATQPTPFDRLQASELEFLPLTVDVLFRRGLELEKGLPLKSSAAELRSCDRSYALASQLLDRVRYETLQAEMDHLRHASDWSDLTPHRVGIWRRLFELEGDPADLATAFQAAEQGRTGAFVELLALSRARLLGGVIPEVRDKEASLLRQLREHDLRIEMEESKAGSTGTPLRKLWEDRQQTEAELRQLVAYMEKQFPRYAALKYPKPCSVEEARACLDANDVALHFVLGKEESYALLLEAKPAPDDKAKGLAIFVLPGRDAIADGVAALTDADTLALPARVRDLGAELYSQLLAPLAGRLRGKDLVIVPDGPLGYLPFELLVEPADGGGRFLVEGHRIRYAPSLTALHLGRLWAEQRQRPTERSLWALGDPVYGADDERLTGQPALAAASRDAERELAWREGQSAERFGRLRYSGQEVEQVRERLGESGTVLLGKGATEAAVRQASAEGELARARYVHFACHGILGLSDGQPPALALSLVGNSGQRDEYGVLDGFLRLDEVTNLRLNADLVVLSACRSGQGRLYNGEGVHGLARAFLHAGSKGVVCSLWAVDDKETAGFMVALYGRLKDDRPAADALRDTRLELIRAGKAPLYWAPFVLIGE